MATGTSWGPVASAIHFPLGRTRCCTRFARVRPLETRGQNHPDVQWFCRQRGPAGRPLEIVEMAARFAARVAARVGVFRLLEPLASGRLVALQLERDALAEQRARVAAVHRQRLVELGHRLLQLAVAEELAVAEFDKALAMDRRHAGALLGK